MNIDRHYADVLLARDVTLDDLRSALPRLRGARRIDLVFLRSETAFEDSPAAQRWPFVDMALRDVRARGVEVWHEEGRECSTSGGATRCRHPARRRGDREFLLLNDLEDQRLSELLRAREDPLAARLSVEPEPGEPLARVTQGTWRPPERRILDLGLPPLPTLLGVLFALIAAFLEPLVRVRWALRGRSTVPAPPTSDSPTLPPWLPAAHATIAAVADAGPPYRGPQIAFQTATLPGVAAAFGSRVARAVPRLRLLAWLSFVAVVGSLAVGLGVLQRFVR